MFDYCKKFINNFRNQHDKSIQTDMEEQISELYTKLTDDVIRFELGSDLLPYSDNIFNLITDIRKKYFEKNGYIFPTVRVIDNSNLQENEYCYYIQGQYVVSKFVIPREEDVLSDIRAEFDVMFHDYIDIIFTNEILEKYISSLDNGTNWRLINDIFGYYDNSNLRRILINILKANKSIKNINYIISNICMENAKKLDRCSDIIYFKPIATDIISDIIRKKI